MKFFLTAKVLNIFRAFCCSIFHTKIFDTKFKAYRLELTMNNVDHMFHPMFIVFHWHYHYSSFTLRHFTEIFKAEAIFGTVQSFISLNLQRCEHWCVVSMGGQYPHLDSGADVDSKH